MGTWRRIKVCITALGTCAASTVLVTSVATPGYADTAVGTAEFDGGTVTLQSVDLPDTWLDGAIWVGRADRVTILDPARACLRDSVLDVYISHATQALVFANTDSSGGLADCAVQTLQAFVVPLLEQASNSQAEAISAANLQAQFLVGTADSADELATGNVATAKAASLASTMAGEVLAQYAALSDLTGVYFSADMATLETGAGLILNGQTIGVSSPVIMNASTPVGCLDGSAPCPEIVIRQARSGTSSSSGPSPYVDPHRFEYFNGLTPQWAGGGDKGVFGAVIYNIWRLPERVSNTKDFYATSQDASVTPKDKSRLTKIWSTWESNSNGIRMVEASPMTVVHEGQGETTTYSATLEGNVSAKKDGSGAQIGGSFGLSRSYTRPNHNHGGGAYNATGHYALWETADNGSGYGKEAAGVETWVIPAGSEIGFIWNAHAWWCNDPCGP